MPNIWKFRWTGKFSKKKKNLPKLTQEEKNLNSLLASKEIESVVLPKIQELSNSNLTKTLPEI